MAASNGRIVIVGASLAGLRTAESLRAGGFTGELVLIGDEPHEPYDRPPLSKTVLHSLHPRSCLGPDPPVPLRNGQAKAERQQAAAAE
ncbi:FAD-dependent oxidoreductase [Streptomyces sp. NPDC052109]|uniref:FAD-dependent oxidoreductase n=1 Tax=Streptomyces sp. NPDC052109 TaxID=3155527 RepID=UPI0034154F5D